MALFIANATGNWSSTSTWAAVRNTPTLHATTNRTVSGAGIISSTFTAPNTVNAVTGVMVYIAALGTAGTFTATLRESGADTASTVSVSVNSLKVGGWVYLKLAVPYTYTTTSAGAYAWKLAISGGSGTTTVADNSGATAFAFMSGDNLVSAVPTTNDNVWNAGSNLSSLIVTVDNTSAACGSGAATGTPSSRSITTALATSNSGKIQWSTSANSTLTVKGQIICSVDGHIEMGTTSSPIPSSYTAKLVTNQNGTDTNYDLLVTASGNWKMQGTARTANVTRYVSGSGTAASPLILLADLGLAVNDELAFTGQGAYNQHEKRFVKTINSPTSIVLSSTAGGAEAALTYSHDSDDRILLLTRNVSVESSTSTEHFTFINQATTAGAVDVDHAMCRYVGGTVNNRRGWQNSSGTATHTATTDDFVVYLPDGWGFNDSASTTTVEYTEIIAYGNTAATNVGSIVIAAAKNKTLTDCYAVGNNAIGFYINAAANINTNNCEAWNNNANIQLAGGLRIDNSFTNIHTNFVCEANRTRGMYLSGVANIIFESMESGTYGTNTIDIDFASDSYNEMILRSCVLSSATIVNNYLNIAPGSEIKFDRLNDTDWNHRWYSAFGTAHATGPSCTDTTTIQTGSHNVRLSPENATDGQAWTYYVLARPSYYVTTQGFVRMNAAFYGDAGASVTVNLYLPGSTSPDASYTLPKDGNDNPFSIGATYSSSITGLARVVVTAKSATASAYAYVGKISNGTNPIISVDTWLDGKPAEIMYPELGDPDAVWAVLTSSFTTSGTVGKLVKDVLSFILYLVGRAR